VPSRVWIGQMLCSLEDGGALIIVGLDPRDETVEALVPTEGKSRLDEGQLTVAISNFKLGLPVKRQLNFDLRQGQCR